MKRIALLIVSLILLGLAITYGVINDYFLDVKFKIYFAIFVFIIILNIAIVFLIVGKERSTKIRRLEKRLTAWSSLSYHVNKIGDEAFNELPIGIIIYEKETLFVHWNNNFAQKVFD